MPERGKRGATVSRTVLAVLLAAAPIRIGFAVDADRIAGPPPGGVTGKVIDPSGNPIAGVRVSLARREKPTLVAVTDPGGTFCFCRVDAARDYTLRAEKDGFATIMESDLSVGKRRIAVRNLILRDQNEFHLRQGS